MDLLVKSPSLLSLLMNANKQVFYGVFRLPLRFSSGLFQFAYPFQTSISFFSPYSMRNLKSLSLDFAMDITQDL